MSVGTDWEPVLQAVRTTMLTVDVTGSSIGKISLEVGDEPGWFGDGYKPPYWELSLLQAAERTGGAGPKTREEAVLQIEGFLPWYLPRQTSVLWRRMLVGVKDALRANPVLRGEDGNPTLSDAGPPQLTRVDLVWFSDWQKGIRCHHAVIQFQAWNHFDYTFS